VASIKKTTISWTTKAGEKRTAERYKARYRDEADKEHAKLFKLKRDAEKWIQQETASLVRGDWVDPSDKKITVRKYAAEWEAGQVGAAATARLTDNALRLHILPEIGDLRLGMVRRLHIQAMVKRLEQKGLAPGSVRNIYDVAARMFAAAVDDRRIPSTPCKKIQLPRGAEKEVEIPTIAEIEEIRDRLDPRWQAIPTILVGSGLRIGELLGLRPSDVVGLPDSDGDVVVGLRPLINVRRQRDAVTGEISELTKTAKSRRSVPVGQVVIETLVEHMAEFPTSDDALFLDEWGKPLTYRRWKQLLRDVAAEKVDEDGEVVRTKISVTSHSFRHFAASALISGGASVKQVQTFLGHASATITLRTYAHLFPGDEDRTRDVLDAALSGLTDRADSTRTVAASK
jgi:integrase